MFWHAIQISKKERKEKKGKKLRYEITIIYVYYMLWDKFLSDCVTYAAYVYFLKWRPFDEYPVISSTRLGEQPFLISSFKVASIDTTCVQALKTHSDTLPCTRIVILSHQNIGYPVFFLYRKKNGSIQIPPLRLLFPTCVELDIELEMHALSLFPLPHNQWMHRIEPNCCTLFPNDKTQETY